MLLKEALEDWGMSRKKQLVYLDVLTALSLEREIGELLGRVQPALFSIVVSDSPHDYSLP